MFKRACKKRTDVFLIRVDDGESTLYHHFEIEIAKMVPFQNGFIILGNDMIENVNEDYKIVDEIPYWFNGQGYINKKELPFIFMMENSQN